MDIQEGSAAASPPETPPRPRPRLFLPVTAWLGLLLSAGCTGACLAAVGANLGLFFGGILFAALLVPPLSLAEERTIDQMIVAGAVCDGIATIWLVAAIVSPALSLLQWLLCYLLLIAWCFGLAGLAGLLGRRRPLLGSAAVVTLALAWLTCPIWISPYLSRGWAQSILNRLVPLHPLLAVNGVLANLGAWSERPIAYRWLLSLGQDVPYTLPRSILPALLLYLLLGVATGLASRFRSGRR